MDLTTKLFPAEARLPRRTGTDPVESPGDQGKHRPEGKSLQGKENLRPTALLHISKNGKIMAQSPQVDNIGRRRRQFQDVGNVDTCQWLSLSVRATQASSLRLLQFRPLSFSYRMRQPHRGEFGKEDFRVKLLHVPNTWGMPLAGHHHDAAHHCRNPGGITDPLGVGFLITGLVITNVVAV